ncbi:MAG: hypothetical protein M3Q54_05005 [Actinomycetota bacterium]|jgi:hypothetical protein|nr:hypothetical protein [Rubrobacter sp.]MDQ3236885.1 hypothetical protein [Actinomycetota bacterium]
MVVAEEGEPNFFRWRMEQYRPFIAEGRGQWWASWRKGEPVSSVGIFWQGDLLRFQWVLTAEHARGKGFASGLGHAGAEPPPGQCGDLG